MTHGIQNKWHKTNKQLRFIVKVAGLLAILDNRDKKWFMHRYPLTMMYRNRKCHRIATTQPALHRNLRY